MRVDIWSDVVCPWCYIGKRRFEQALARFPAADQVEVRWHSFELDPTSPGDRGGRYVDRLAEKYGRSTEQAQQMLDTMTTAASGEGLDFHFERARPSGTFDAHRLLHLAAERGVQDAVKERLLRATFTEGEPVADADTLVRLGAEAGLDPDEARTVLASDAYADDVRSDEAQAQQVGISGVPFFVVDGRYGVSGAQPPDLLLEVLQKAWSESKGLQLVAPGGSATRPGAGSCDGDSCAV